MAGKNKKKKTPPGTIVNRKARFNYQILESFEAGIMLKGSEVKSLRAGRANLTDAYAITKGDEIFLLNLHISPYDPASLQNHEPTRTRKLLLHRKEINKLLVKIKENGLTMIPTKVYFNSRGIAKCEIALGKGKAQHDKRETIKKRESDRDMQRALKR